MADYPSAGSSMLPTWNTTKEPVNLYQGPLLPGQDQAAFRESGIERSGGSQPMLSSGAYSYTPPTGQVLGSSTSSPSPAPTNSGPNLKDPNSNPGSGYFWDAADGWKQIGGGEQMPSQGEIDAVFNPIFSVLNQAEGNLRSQQPGLISEAEQAAALAQQSLAGDRTAAEDQLGLQSTQTQNLTDAQIAQQRQLFQELQQANQARFGGASSAGRAASEIQGREFQRNRFGIQQNAQEALQQINVAKQEVLRNYQQKRQELELQLQQTKSALDRQFQDRMLEIAKARGETESAKANARMQTLADYRNKQFQINVARQQFEQELQLQAMQNAAALEQAQAQYSGATGAGNAALIEAANRNPGDITNVTAPTQQSTSPQYTGQIQGASTTRDEEVRNSILNSNPFSAAFNSFRR